MISAAIIGGGAVALLAALAAASGVFPLRRRGAHRMTRRTRRTTLQLRTVR